MKISPEVLLPRTICWQIIAFTALSLVLGNAITFGILSYQFRTEQRLHQEETVAAIITTFAGLLAPAETPSEFSKLVAQGRAIGIAVQEVPKAQLATQRVEQEEYRGFAKALAEMSSGDSAFTVLSQQDQREPDGSSLLVRLSNDRILSFTLPSDANRPPVFGGTALLTASIGMVFVLVLSTYVLWSITSPLSLFATAAEEFGRSLKDGQPLREKGPREIAKMAHVLNTMRSRIVSLIEERTAMLIAIGHDLRTPLTRIVLQAERLPHVVHATGDVERFDQHQRSAFEHAVLSERRAAERAAPGCGSSEPRANRVLGIRRPGSPDRICRMRSPGLFLPSPQLDTRSEQHC